MIGSNTIEYRNVHRRVPAANGGFAWEYVTQMRTRNTLVELLGVSLGPWSDWKDQEKDPPVYLDENDNPVTP